MPRAASHVRRTLLEVWPLVATIACLLAMSWWALGIMSASRAYVAGESLWSKAQKNAVIHILDYAHSRDEADYRLFVSEVARTESARAARLALQRRPRDLERARRGFLGAGNHPADVDGLIRMFREYESIGFMRSAIATWTLGDELVLGLEAVGASIRDEVRSPHPSNDAIEQLRSEVLAINARLTPLEAEFSGVVGTAGRTIAGGFVSLMLGATAVLASFGLVLVHRRRMAADATRAERDVLLSDTVLAFDLTQAVNRATLLKEVYDPALDALLAGLHVERASILLFDADGVMRFKAWRGLSEGYRRAAEGHTPWLQDAKNPALVLVEDATLDEGLAAYRPLFASEGIRALAFFPLVHQGVLLGKFMTYSAQPRRFQARELRLVQVIATQVAAAVVRARLFESERAYASQWSSLYEREREAVTKRDQFIAIASHELRTPLTALKLNAQLLDRRGLAVDPTDRPFLRLWDNIGRLERLIVQLLDVSRISGGNVTLERRPTNLGEIVDTVVQRAQTDLSRAGSLVEVEISDAVIGNWDQERLDQVVTNLLHNAIKYGQGRLISMRVERACDKGVLLVRDRGIGIALEDQSRIFERFERAVSHEHFGGFGLGLWIVRALVEAHGGTVTLESAPGEGAAFRVELPIGEPPRLAARADVQLATAAP